VEKGGTMTNNISPIKEKERLIAIDVMRGISILGIFLVNIFAFTTPYLYVDQAEYAETKFDQWAYQFVDIFVQASFYPLFAFLFGYGLFILKNRIEDRNKSFRPLAVRRFSLLILFGFLHAVLLWPGDILFVYGVCGLLSLLFIQLSPKALTSISITAYTLFFGFITLLSVISEKLGLMDDYYESLIPLANAVTDIYQSDSFIEITFQRFIDWKSVNIDGYIEIIFAVLPFVLLGIAAGKSKKFAVTERNRRFFKKVLLIALPIGLFLKGMPYLLGGSFVFEVIQDYFGGAILAAAYILIIFLLVKDKETFFSRSFANVGKMSLSNYLIQSIICSTLFYGYGFGWFMKVSYSNLILFVLVIYFLQIIFSSIWLRKFRFGPFEWILRSFTYWRVQIMKIN